MDLLSKIPFFPAKPKNTQGQSPIRTYKSLVKRKFSAFLQVFCLSGPWKKGLVKRRIQIVPSSEAQLTRKILTVCNYACLPGNQVCHVIRKSYRLLKGVLSKVKTLKRWQFFFCPRFAFSLGWIRFNSAPFFKCRPDQRTRTRTRTRTRKTCFRPDIAGKKRLEEKWKSGLKSDFSLAPAKKVQFGRKSLIVGRKDVCSWKLKLFAECDEICHDIYLSIFCTFQNLRLFCSMETWHLGSHTVQIWQNLFLYFRGTEMILLMSNLTFQ